MALFHKPNIVTDSLKMVIDPKNSKFLDSSGNPLNIIGEEVFTNDNTVITDTMVLNSADGTIANASRITSLLPESLPGKNFTMQIWFKFIPNTSLDQFPYVFAFTADGTSGAQKFIIHTGKPDNDISIQKGIKCNIAAGGELRQKLVQNVFEFGEWVNCAVSYDGVSIKMYVNGELVAEQVYSSSADISGEANRLTFGACESTQYFNGEISSSLLYHKVLSDSEVKQNFNALRGRFGI